MKTNAPNIPTDRDLNSLTGLCLVPLGFLIVGFWSFASDPARPDHSLPLLLGGGFILCGFLLLFRGLGRRRRRGRS